VRPYVVKQGDYLAKLAFQLGFDADQVWNDPKNADLKAKRPDPNLLWPTDVLYIPDPVDAPLTNLTPGTTNSFVTDAPNVPMTLRFLDPDCASQACTVQELPELTGLTTDENGNVTLTVPITTETVTIVFTDSGKTFVVGLGHLDPIGTLSGVFQRLQNLGYIDESADCGSASIDDVRAALRSFKAAQPDGDSVPPASSPAGSDLDGAPPSSSGPPSVPDGPPPSSNSSPSTAGSGPPSSNPPASDGDSEPPSSSPPSSSPPPSSVPPPSSSSGNSADDNAGLSDDGTLDAATAQLLVAAHGS
jgi:hypothetical protein